MSNEILFYGGKIVTLDPANPIAEAVLIKGNRIAGVGASSDLRGQAVASARLMDLEGQMMIPGIVDSHNHLPTAGKMMKDGVLLFDAFSIDDVKRKVGEKAKALAPGAWLVGGGWIESSFSDKRLPNRWDLDEVAPDNPVVLYRLFGMVVANSKALEAAGIDASSPDPEKGQVDRDPETKEPTGILRDWAVNAVRSVIPEEEGGLEDQMEAILHSGREYLKYGITSVIDPGVGPETMRAYHWLYRKGQLPLRVHMMPVWHGLFYHDGADLTERLDHLGLCSGFGDEWLRVGALKMAIDGGLGSQTAMLNEAYLDPGKAREVIRLDLERLKDYMYEGLSRGWSIGIHCCGGRAQDLAMDAFAGAMKRLPKRDFPEFRNNIIHGYFPSGKALDMMKELGVSVSLQPTFTYVEGDIYPDDLPMESLEGFKPVKSYRQHGIVVAANSDMTSSHYNPFWGIYAALTRKTRTGLQLGTAEVLDRTSTLEMFTVAGAYLSFEENIKGRLIPGYLADLAVVDTDLLEADPEDILEAKVTMTILDGQIVFER